MTQPDTETKYLSKGDFAAHFNISVPTVHRLISSGAISALKIGGSIRIPICQIERYERQLASEPRLEQTTRGQEREGAAAAQCSTGQADLAPVVDPASAPTDLIPTAPESDDPDDYPPLIPPASEVDVDGYPRIGGRS